MSPESPGALKAENDALRRLLWSTHACSGRVPGLQCADCAIDFARDTLALLEQRLQARSIRWLEVHQGDVCVHCGVGRLSWEALEHCSHGGRHEWVSPDAL